MSQSIEKTELSVDQSNATNPLNNDPMLAASTAEDTKRISTTALSIPTSETIHVHESKLPLGVSAPTMLPALSHQNARRKYFLDQMHADCPAHQYPATILFTAATQGNAPGKPEGNKGFALLSDLLTVPELITEFQQKLREGRVLGLGRIMVASILMNDVALKPEDILVYEQEDDTYILSRINGSFVLVGDEVESDHLRIKKGIDLRIFPSSFRDLPFHDGITDARNTMQHRVVQQWLDSSLDGYTLVSSLLLPETIFYPTFRQEVFDTMLLYCLRPSEFSQKRAYQIPTHPEARLDIAATITRNVGELFNSVRRMPEFISYVRKDGKERVIPSVLALLRKEAEALGFAPATAETLLENSLSKLNTIFPPLYHTDFDFPFDPDETKIIARYPIHRTPVFAADDISVMTGSILTKMRAETKARNQRLQDQLKIRRSAVSIPINPPKKFSIARIKPYEATDENAHTIEKELLDKGFTLFPAYGGADSFFDAIGQLLEFKGLIKEDKHTSVCEQVRTICHERLLNNASPWAEAAMNAEAMNDKPIDNIMRQNYGNRRAMMSFTQSQIDALKAAGGMDFSQIAPIWGNADIEGRMVCEEFNVMLHVLAFVKNRRGEISVEHRLIDANGSRVILREGIELTHPGIRHLDKHGNVIPVGQINFGDPSIQHLDDRGNRAIPKKDVNFDHPFMLHLIHYERSYAPVISNRPVLAATPSLPTLPVAASSTHTQASPAALPSSRLAYTHVSAALAARGANLSAARRRGGVVAIDAATQLRLMGYQVTSSAPRGYLAVPTAATVVPFAASAGGISTAGRAARGAATSSVSNSVTTAGMQSSFLPGIPMPSDTTGAGSSSSTARRTHSSAHPSTSSSTSLPFLKK